MAAADERSMPFIKHLASSDRKIRTSALSTLRTFLAASTTARTLTPVDNLKLWKGLFYSLWMCDRPVPQQNLCADLAGLAAGLPDAAVGPWLRAFWATMAREWTSIDVLRMEKFLLLVRRVLASSLAWTREGGKGGSGGAKGKRMGRKARRAEMLAVLAEWPLEKESDFSKVPVGLRLHVLDIWVDELDRSEMLGEAAGEADSEDREFLEGIRELVEVQAKDSFSKPIRQRAKDSLADERLPWNEAAEEDDDEEGGDEDGEDEEDDFGGFDD